MTADGATPSRPLPSPGEGKPILGATVNVDVGGTAGSTPAVARVDTGAARTCLDSSLAADVRAGPITGTTRVKSARSSEGRKRPVVEIVVGIDGHPHIIEASIEDREHMRFPVLLGRDVLEHYTVDPSQRVNGERSGSR